MPELVTGKRPCKRDMEGERQRRAMCLLVFSLNCAVYSTVCLKRQAKQLSGTIYQLAERGVIITNRLSPKDGNAEMWKRQFMSNTCRHGMLLFQMAEEEVQ